MTGPTVIPAQGVVVGALTDGTGVSGITVPKIVKDFIADALISSAAALTAANVLSLQQAVTAPNVAVFAIAGAVLHAGYRVVLRWATTD